MCSKLTLSKDNENFIDVLTSEVGLQILRENILFIHIETGNIFYENYNTNESIYDFLLRQHYEIKKIIHATLKLWTNLTFLQTKTLNIFFTNLMTTCCLTGKTLFQSGTLKS